MTEWATVEDFKFRIGGLPFYIGMNDIKEFPYFKGMSVWQDLDLSPNEICIYDATILPYWLEEWRNGIRHDVKTCKAQRWPNRAHKVSF